MSEFSQDDSDEHFLRELEQEKIILLKLEKEVIENSAQIEKEQSIKLNKKQSVIISLLAAGVTAVVNSSFLFVTVLTGQQYKIENIGNIQSGYIIQNLRGDTIDTWLSGRIVSGTVLHVGLINAEKYPDRVSLKEIILSDEAIEIDDLLMHKGPKGNISTYFVGWSGSLKDASKQSTEFYIPTNLEVAYEK